MKIHRIYAVLLRYIYLFGRSYDRLIETFYWPTIDLVLWGITSKFISQYNPEANTFLVMIVSGIVFWLFVVRSQVDISINLLEELWNRNLVNLFVTPLKLSEWLVGSALFGITKTLVSVSFACILAYFFYSIEIFDYGFYLIPFGILLILNGWWIGLFINSCIYVWGTRVQMLAWSLVLILAPFSGVYYPISVLPVWAQKISMFVPTSYIFEGAREVIATGSLDLNKLIYSSILTFVYLVLSVLMIKYAFKVTLNRGLVKVF